MISKPLLNILVPDAPRHLRTDRDSPVFDELAQERLTSARTLGVLELAGRLNTPSLVSSFRGALRRLLFSIPRYAVSEAAPAAAYRSLIAALRPGTRFVVACKGADRAAVTGWFTDAGHAADHVTFAELPDFLRITVWAEDAYVGLTDSESGARFLMEPWEFPRSGDALIADAVENATGDISASQSPLIFQGGNCLIADDHWMMGQDYYFDTERLVYGAGSPVEPPADVSRRDFIEGLFATYLDRDRPLLLLGTNAPLAVPDIAAATGEGGAFFLDLPSGGAGTFQPIFHIDMLISLAGPSDDGFQVLVGDPRMAEGMLGTPMPYALPAAYDAIAAQLTATGYAVRRNPIVHWPSPGDVFSLAELADISRDAPDDPALAAAVEDLRDLGAASSDTVRVRNWHHITWNNCLVENSAAEGRHVYLPTFGHGDKAALAEIDAHIAVQWQELGFEVHRLGDFNWFAERQGVVHCIKKYIDRDADAVV